MCDGWGGGGGGRGANLNGYMCITHLYLYWLAVQAGFYSNAVECNTLSQAERVRSPVAEKCDMHFFHLILTYKHEHIINSELYTLFLDGSTVSFHLAFNLLDMQAN